MLFNSPCIYLNFQAKLVQMNGIMQLSARHVVHFFLVLKIGLTYFVGPHAKTVEAVYTDENTWKNKETAGVYKSSLHNEWDHGQSMLDSLLFINFVLFFC